MNRWHVYSAMKTEWIANQGEQSLTVMELLNLFPDLNDHELQEGIVEFRLMASRCFEAYGFNTDIRLWA
ncbi:hypothetical protein [Paenibacillus sp. Soil724D2]|uniref:hypothetical protein n=1 Tax=Paenibacillus sp. (strain Soil724D2) TaxID=1736392 RepID=UPI0007155298|nr:hypothetical protein [Paenibacillus sp. Soil724D2]KRE33271.1 hypothetical protein ASG85_13400 [Paenibacillus sp. Soil724D2]